MTELTFSTRSRVTLTRIEGDDLDVARAAWVSTKGERAEDEDNLTKVHGLIKMLMRDRHGSPFEQVGLQFLTSAPIFVWREHMRHRVASYNEMSGRYTVLPPEFYVPDPHRPLVQQGKPGAYTFVEGNEDQVRHTQEYLMTSAQQSYEHYEALLAAGVAKEVARMCLPVNIFSTAYVRMNLRALMNFLSLRTHDDGSTFPSFPQWEIEHVAQAYETFFADHFPLVHDAFNTYGRVAP